MNASNHPVRVDRESGALVITGLRIVEPDVLAECRHWSQGRRGAAVEMGELAGADLTAFAEQALVIGSTALAAAAGVQQRYGSRRSWPRSSTGRPRPRPARRSARR